MTAWELLPSPALAEVTPDVGKALLGAGAKSLRLMLWASFHFGHLLRSIDKSCML